MSNEPDLLNSIRMMPEQQPSSASNLKNKICSCRSWMKDKIDSALRDECKCATSLLPLRFDFDSCNSTLRELQNSTAGRQVGTHIYEAVRRMLGKAREWSTSFECGFCDESCVQTCPVLRALTKKLLETKTLDMRQARHESLVKDFLKAVKGSPRVVLCRCFLHLNSLAADAYLEMAYVAVASTLIPVLEMSVDRTLPAAGGVWMNVQTGFVRNLAASSGNSAKISKALENRNLVNSKDNQGYTALHVALILGDVEMATLLLASGADANIPDREGNTPLLIATITEQTKLVGMLEAKGADPFLANNRGYSPFLMALTLRNKDVFEVMLTQNPHLHKNLNVTGSEDEGWVMVKPRKEVEEEIVRESTLASGEGNADGSIEIKVYDDGELMVLEIQHTGHLENIMVGIHFVEDNLGLPDPEVLSDEEGFAIFKPKETM